MLYGVLRTWLIAKEIIQRSAKAMKKNIDPLWTAMTRCCSTAPSCRNKWFSTKSHRWMGWPEKPPNFSPRTYEGIPKELGSESNLLTGKREARMFRSRVHMHSDGTAAGLKNPGSGTEDLEANCSGLGKLGEYHSS